MDKAKNGKTTSSLDGVNPALQSRFESVMNLEAEISAYEEALKMLKAGTISVRGVKATIQASMEKGSLPTIKPSSAQYFVISEQVRALAGGKDKPLKTVLNVATQAKRAFKQDTEKVISESKTFAEFASKIPSQGERAKAGRKTSVPVVDTVDAFVSLFLGATELTDLKVNNKEQWDKFINLVSRISQYNKRNHPSMVKASA